MIRKLTENERERRLGLSECTIKTHELSFNPVKYKGNLLFIDIETTGWKGAPLETNVPFDISYKVYDNKTSNTLKYGTILIKEFYEDDYLRSTPFCTKKIREKYVGKIEGHETTEKMTIKEFHEFMTKLINNYNIKIMCAYNAKFDYTKLIQMFALNYMNSPFDKLNYFDIANMVCNVFGTNDLYKNFCKVNGYYSTSGSRKNQCKVPVEIVCKWLMGNDFQEEHTGLEDLKNELNIYHICKMIMFTNGAKQLLKLNRRLDLDRKELVIC